LIGMSLLIAGLIVLAWVVLSVVTAVVWAWFMRGAQVGERVLPTHETGIRDWVMAGRQAPASRRKRRPPAA
jgi:hypothetical protein